MPVYPSRMRSIVALLFAFWLSTAAGQNPDSATAEDLMRQALAAQQQGNLRAAIEGYRKILAERPSSIEARANLGAALAADGQLDAAIEEDQRVLAVVPGQLDIRMNLALAYYKKADWRNASEQFEQVHTARPQDLSAAMLLGFSEIKLGRAEAAAKLLAPLEPGNEDNMDFQFVLADALIASGKEAEGVSRMERTARATNALDAWVIAGTTRLHRQEFHEARTDLDTALSLNSALPGLNSLAGQARDALGDVNAAQVAFEAALDQNPRDPTANLYLGTMRLKQLDFEGARPLLELALQLQPDLPQTQFQMAVLNARTGHYAEAVTALEALEKRDPGWLDPHIQLAPLYYKLNRAEDGRREREIVQRLEDEQQKQGPPAQ